MALAPHGRSAAVESNATPQPTDSPPGPAGSGLRRIPADLAESATTDDRVKHRLGGWQDSETRKPVCQDRQTDELRAEAAKVRRALRLGALAAPNGK